MLTQHQEPDRLEIPHEPGNYFYVRALSKEQMDKARGQTMQELVNTFGADNVELILKMQRLVTGKAQHCVKCAETLPAEEQEEPDELAGISPSALVHYGVKRWEGPNYTETLSPDTLKELDTKTVDWAAREVLHRSEPTAGESTSSENMSSVAASAPPQPASESPPEG